MMDPVIEYLPDSDVSDALDAELRGLLTTCFTKPEDEVFRERRYFVQPYPNRWVIRNADRSIAAHIGVHEKTVTSDGKPYRIGGIAEVCVHPDNRGLGYVRAMLLVIHAWMARHGFVFSVLFGDPRVYGSSGYVHVDNLVHGSAETGWSPAGALVKPLTEIPWPVDTVQLPGPKF